MKRATLFFGFLGLCVSPVSSNLLPNTSCVAFAQEASAAKGDVSTLVQELSSEDAPTRWRAAKSLGELGSAAEPALPALINALKDENPSVRLYAATALGAVGDSGEPVVKALIQAVGDEESRVRIAAVNSIRDLVNDPSVVVPMLVRMIETEDPLFASRIVETIVLRGEKAVPFLLEALKYDRAAYWACLAIEEMGDVASETVPALVELLSRQPDDSLRLQALLALAKLGPAAAPAKDQVLAALSSDTSVPVMVGGAYASGMLGFTEATPSLEKTKGNEDPMLAMVSFWALAKLHPDDEARMTAAVDHLVQGLGSKSANLRLTAAKGLQSLEVDPAKVGPKLVELLDDPDPIVAYHLAETFASLGESAAPRAGAALSNEKLRGLAAQVLQRLGPKAKAALPDIIDALSDADGDYRRQLQSILGEIGPDASSATPELIRSLDDSSEETRISALLALGNIGPRAVAAKSKVLSLADSNTDPFESTLAAWVIAKIAAADEQAITKVVPVLIQGLSFADERVQAEAAMTLGELGPAARDASAALDRLSNDTSAPAELREIAKTAAAAVR